MSADPAFARQLRTAIDFVEAGLVSPDREAGVAAVVAMSCRALSSATVALGLAAVPHTLQ